MLLDFDELTWFVGAVGLAITLVVLWRRKRSAYYLLCLSVFWVYMLFVVKETLFPIPLSGQMLETMREQTTFMSGVNLIPGRFGAYGPFFDRTQLLLNVVLAVPFGFGMSFVARVRGMRVPWLALSFGIGIEMAQLIISLALGFTYRVVDVNDVLLNSLGVIVGYGLFRLFSKWYVAMTRRFAVAHTGLSAYVYDVAGGNAETAADELGGQRVDTWNASKPRA